LYITLKDFAAKHPWPSEAALRAMYYVAKREDTGYLEAFAKVGRRLVINPDAFFAIIEIKNRRRPDEKSK
jgi:hypothetical protein